VAACAPTTSSTGIPYGGSLSPVPHATTVADVAVNLAHADGKPPRKATYLRPLRQLQQVCADPAPTALAQAVATVTAAIMGERLLVAAPRAAAAAELAAEARHGANCAALGRTIAKSLAGRLAGSASLYSGHLRFSPPLTSELALASIEHSVLPGKVHVVYALTAYSCQQAIFMGPALGRRYGNAGLGAFVELTSGNGVGHGKYDANRVNRARITPLGRIGGQPCR
jgi:hypothetical protein